MTISGFLRLAAQTLTAPQEVARLLLALNLPREVLLTGFALVVVLIVVKELSAMSRLGRVDRLHRDAAKALAEGLGPVLIFAPRRRAAEALAAQIARNRRITGWVKDKLAELRAAGRPQDEFAFVVHGTMAAALPKN